VPVTRFNNPVLSLSLLCSRSFLSNSSNCYSSNNVGPRKLMAFSPSNAILGDVYVDDLISSYSSVQDFTKHAGVYFKERTHKGFVRGSLSLRRPQQVLYGPLRIQVCFMDSGQRISRHFRLAAWVVLHMIYRMIPALLMNNWKTPPLWLTCT